MGRLPRGGRISTRGVGLPRHCTSSSEEVTDNGPEARAKDSPSQMETENGGERDPTVYELLEERVPGMSAAEGHRGGQEEEAAEDGAQRSGQQEVEGPAPSDAGTTEEAGERQPLRERLVALDVPPEANLGRLQLSAQSVQVGLQKVMGQLEEFRGTTGRLAVRLEELQQEALQQGSAREELESLRSRVAELELELEQQRQQQGLQVQAPKEGVEKEPRQQEAGPSSGQPSKPRTGAGEVDPVTKALVEQLVTQQVAQLVAQQVAKEMAKVDKGKADSQGKAGGRGQSGGKAQEAHRPSEECRGDRGDRANRGHSPGRRPGSSRGRSPEGPRRHNRGRSQERPRRPSCGRSQERPHRPSQGHSQQQGRKRSRSRGDRRSSPSPKRR